METKIISAFPACGKTYAFKKLNEKGYKILDSDSSQFSWCYDHNPKLIQIKLKSTVILNFQRIIFSTLKRILGKLIISL